MRYSYLQPDDVVFFELDHSDAVGQHWVDLDSARLVDDFGFDQAWVVELDQVEREWLDCKSHHSCHRPGHRHGRPPA